MFNNLDFRIVQNKCDYAVFMISFNKMLGQLNLGVPALPVSVAQLEVTQLANPADFVPHCATFSKSASLIGPVHRFHYPHP